MANQSACPICGSPAAELLPLDSGFKQRLRESGQAEPIPDAVCGICYSQFSGNVSQGAQLRVKENAKQHHRMTMWRNRMTLIKQARDKMAHSCFAEAAVLYEKYIRVIEIVYEVEAGKLSADLFNNKARTKELTLLTSVYWDLIRIYDSAPKYKDRLDKAVEKLIIFAPHSGIIIAITKNAANYSRQSKNKAIFQRLEKQLGIQRKGCFIATAVFESEVAPEVIKLREFRDRHLESHWAGRVFTQIYYFVSPSLIPYIHRFPVAKRAGKSLLRKLANRI